MLTAVVLSNINPVFVKVIFTSGWTPAQMYFVTLLVIAVIMLLYQIVEMEHGGKWGMTKEDIVGTLLATASGGVAAPILFFQGLTMVNASTAIILSSVLPLFVVFMAVLFLRERFTLQMISGGLFLVASMCVLLWQDILAFEFRPGVLYILGSSFLSAFTVIVHKKYVKHRHIDSIILVRTLLSLVLVGVWVVYTDGPNFSFLTTPQNIWPVLALPVCSFIIPYFLYFRALRNLTAGDAGVMEALGRVFGIAAAAVLLGETLGIEHLASMTLATFGIILINVPLTKWRIAPSRLPVIGPLRK